MGSRDSLFTLVLGTQGWAQIEVAALLKKLHLPGEHRVFSAQDYRVPFTTDQTQRFVQLWQEVVDNGLLFTQPMVIEFRDIETLPLKTSFSVDAQSFLDTLPDLKKGQQTNIKFQDFFAQILLRKPPHIQYFLTANKGRLNQLDAIWQTWLTQTPGTLIDNPVSLYSIKKWAQQKAADLFLDINDETLEALLYGYGLQPKELEQFFDKAEFLSFLKQPVLPEQLNELAGLRLDLLLFVLGDFLIENKWSQFWQTLAPLLSKEGLGVVFHVLAMRCRRLHSIKLAMAKQNNLTKVAAQTKIPLWLIKKEWGFVQKVSLSQLEDWLCLFAQDDLSIKYLAHQGDQKMVQDLIAVFHTKRKNIAKKTWILR